MVGRSGACVLRLCGAEVPSTRPWCTYRMFLECCGDPPVSHYHRKDLAKFYDLARSSGTLLEEQGMGGPVFG
jgi:hypothetical protein